MRTATGFRWAARILSLVMVGFLVATLWGEAAGFSGISGNEKLLLLCFPGAVVTGFAISWWRELAGAVVSLGGVAAFYAIHLAGSHGWPRGPFFVIFAAPAFLFLIAGFLEGRKNGADADPG